MARLLTGIAAIALVWVVFGVLDYSWATGPLAMHDSTPGIVHDAQPRVVLPDAAGQGSARQPSPAAEEQQRAPANVQQQVLPGRYHYIAWWEWHSERYGVSRWRCPEGSCAGAIDLRCRSQMAEAGVQTLCAGSSMEPWGWFVYDVPQDICESGCAHRGMLVGEGDSASLTSSLLRDLSGLLGVDLGADTPADMLAELLTQDADPLGVERWKPVRSREIHMDGLVHQETSAWFDPAADPAWHDNVIRTYWEDYRRIREESLDRGDERYKRVLDKWSEDTRLPPEDFVPSDLEFEGTLPHRTTITEAWGCADSDSLDCDLTWTEVEKGDDTAESGDFEIISNKAEDISPSDTGSNTQASARAEHDLSGDDHYAQAEVTWENAIRGQLGGTVVRFDPSATTYYRGGGHSAGDSVRLHKIVTGTPTELLSEAQTIGAETLTVVTTADGSSISVKVGSGSTFSVTDSDITGNLRTGIGSDVRGNGQQSWNHEWDNFEAADLEAAAAGDRLVWQFIVSTVRNDGLLAGRV